MKDITDITEYLRAHLGAKLVCYITNTYSTSILQSWIDGKTSPNEDQQQRLRAAETIYTRVARHEESFEVAAAWFRGTSAIVLGSEVSPAEAIRGGYYEAASYAAGDMIAGAFS